MAIARAQRRVDAAPIPGARLRAAETSLSTGAQLEQAKGQKLETIAGVFDQGTRIAGGLYERVVTEERNKANEVALLEASNKLAAWKTKTLYDPDNGALTKKGKDAMPLPEQVTDEFNTLADGIASGLGNEEQKSAFNKLRAQTFAQTDLELRRHVFGEMQEYRATELKAAIDNGVNDAVRSAADPTLVGLNLAKVEQQMRTNLPRLGVGGEALEKQIGDVRSNVHVGVISQLLATSQDKKAQAYFDEVKGQINGDKLDEVEKALEVGSTRAEGQATADKIIAEGGSLNEQLAKAKGLDPKVREVVEQRIEHNNIIENRLADEKEKADMKSGYDLIDKTGNIASIPAAMWASYSGATRSAMTSYAEQKARGIPIKTDLPTYYGLMRSAMGDPTTFANTNLLNYRSKLDEVEFKQLAALQLSIKNGDKTAAEKEVASFRTSQQVVDDALVGMGIDPNVKVEKDPVKANAVANLRRMVDIRIADLQANTGKKVTSTDVQSITDALLAQTITQRGTWGGLFTSAPFYDTSKPAIEATIDDVPAAQRKQIEDALKAKGRPVSNATILSTWLEAVARGHVKAAQ